jgi:hypothetical protein
MSSGKEPVPSDPMEGALVVAALKAAAWTGRQ